MDMLNFFHTFEPSAVAFALGPITIHWYGITMASAMLVAILVAQRLARRVGIASSVVADGAFFIIIFGLLGARVYAVFLELPFYLAHPAEIIAVWHGGLAIHGALLGGGLALVWFCARNGFSILQWTDLAAPGIALGQAMGRWGNYFNQELFGLPTSAPWGIPIAERFRPAAYANALYFHPTFLYESFLNLMSFGIVSFLFYRRSVLGAHTQSRHFGLVTGVYLINYGLIRILMEQFRIDSTPILVGVRLPVVASLVLVGLGITLLGFWLTRRRAGGILEKEL